MRSKYIEFLREFLRQMKPYGPQWVVHPAGKRHSALRLSSQRLWLRLTKTSKNTLRESHETPNLVAQLPSTCENDNRVTYYIKFCHDHKNSRCKPPNDKTTRVTTAEKPSHHFRFKAGKSHA